MHFHPIIDARRLFLKAGRLLVRRDRQLRHRLWRHPHILAIVGGTGLVLYWRGIWHLADVTPVLENAFVSLLAGIVLLASSGLLVMQLIGQAALEEQLTDLQKMERAFTEEEHALAAEEDRFHALVKAEVLARARRARAKRAKRRLPEA